MESFINALARAQENVWPPSQAQMPPVSIDSPRLAISEEVLTLLPGTLKANRVVSFDGGDGMSRAFDVLRNLCTNGLAPRVPLRPVLGITAPTPGCGTSTNAANLAFSLARQQRGAVLLADLSRPGEGWWHRFGVDQTGSDARMQRDNVLRLDVAGTMIHATSLTPVIGGTSGDELKQAMRDWLARVGRDLGPVSIVLDLPPLLSDDRVSSLISEVDRVLLVLATGRSTMAELDTCKSYLHDATSVQLVLNKARSYDL